MIRFETKPDAQAEKKEAQPKAAKAEAPVQLTLDGDVAEDQPSAKSKRKGGRK